MVDFDVVAHPQQLVQARGRLTGIHIKLIIRKIGNGNGFKI